MSRGRTTKKRANVGLPFLNDEGVELIGCDHHRGPLFIGNAEVARNRLWLDEKHIIAIVNATSNVKNFYETVYNYVKLDIADSEGQDLRRPLMEKGVADFIHSHRENGSAVLVHCRQGQSRSVTVVCMYLVEKLGYTLRQCVDLLAEKAIYTKINHGFKQQLMALEFRILNANTHDFFDLGPRIRQATVPHFPEEADCHTQT